MNQDVEDEISMKQYLLGQLSEEESIRLEQRLMTSDVTYQQLSLAEDDLIDDYVGGALSQEEREKFEKLLLSNPGRRQEVKFAGALRRYVVCHQSTSFRQSVANFWRAQSSAVNWSLAAGLLLVIFGGVSSAIKIAKLQDEVEIARSQPPTSQGQIQEVQRQLAEQNSRNAQLTEELQSRKKQQTTLEQELASLKRPILASFVLMPGSRQRALGEADQKIVISSGANLVRLELSSPAPVHASYRASLKNSYGQEIWFQAELKSKTVGHVQVVVLSLPTDLLTSDSYSLKLTGVTTSSDLEEIGSCQFQVLRR
jgi:hypothetical protein